MSCHYLVMPSIPIPGLIQRWWRGCGSHRCFGYNAPKFIGHFDHALLVIRFGYKESTPLKNMRSSVGILIPNIWTQKICSKPSTRCKKDLNPFYPLGVAIFDVPLGIFLRKSTTFPQPQAGRTWLLEAHLPQDVEFVATGPTKCGINQNIPG